jgi:hypothetical protein
MASFFSSILDTVRVWLGLDHDALHPSHGWLLPPPGLVLARVTAVRTPARGSRR